MSTRGEWVPVYEHSADPINRWVESVPALERVELGLIYLLPVLALLDLAATVEAVVRYGMSEAAPLALAFASWGTWRYGFLGMAAYDLVLLAVFTLAWRYLPRPYGAILCLALAWTWAHHAVTNALLFV